MKRVLLAVSAISLLAAPIASAQQVQSGSFVMDLSEIPPAQGDNPLAPFTNVLGNPGFETGDLPPWTSEAWGVTDQDANSGSYSAEGIGSNWVRQDFDPIDVGDILAVSMYTKQPEEAIQAVDFYYSASDFDEFVIFPGADWTFMDMTSELRAVGQLQAIRIWGYSGGGPDEDLTRVDDVVIDVGGATPPEQSTWGQVKTLYK